LRKINVNPYQRENKLSEVQENEMIAVTAMSSQLQIRVKWEADDDVETFEKFKQKCRLTAVSSRADGTCPPNSNPALILQLVQ